jgi:hypothetical protein
MVVAASGLDRDPTVVPVTGSRYQDRSFPVVMVYTSAHCHRFYIGSDQRSG